jgi:hypothetical protein
MLWYQYLLGVALWAYPQAPKVPHGSMVQVNKLVVTTHIAELLAPPPPVTVTVTVGGKLSLQTTAPLRVNFRRKLSRSLLNTSADVYFHSCGHACRPCCSRSPSLPYR